jgi:membrane protease YdiL (CAAX protease family)
MAFKTARVFNAPADDPARRALPPLVAIYRNTIVALFLLLVLAWVTPQTFDYRLFALPTFGARQLFAGAGALLFQFVMIYVSWAVRSTDELSDMAVSRILPRSSREHALYSVMSIVAGISEETAYRGVLTSVLWIATGSAWVAVLISALAFAVTHALQGWKSMVMVFVMACSMHALVWYTGTLVIAMAVHAIYDLLVPTLRRRILPVPPTDPGRTAG